MAEGKELILKKEDLTFFKGPLKFIWSMDLVHVVTMSAI